MPQENKLKIDKFGFTLSLVSFILLILAYGFYIEYDRYDVKLSGRLAAGLSIINPSKKVGLAFENQNDVYIDEARAILLVYTVSLLLCSINFLRLIMNRVRGIDNRNFAGLITLYWVSGLKYISYFYIWFVK